MLPVMSKLQGADVANIVGIMPSGKFQLVKVLRDIFGLGLKEAKDIMDDFVAGKSEVSIVVHHELSADDHRKLFTYGLHLVSADFVYIVEQGCNIEAVFVSEVEANKFADFQNRLFASKCYESALFTVTKKPITRNAEELCSETKAELRQKAISKLSAIERFVLGIEE